MSEKNRDDKNRWRNVTIAFRMSPEENEELNNRVKLSGFRTKQPPQAAAHGDRPVRKADDRMFVQDVEKGGIEAIGRLREKFERKSAETHTKIVRTFVQMEDRTRQDQQQRIARNAVAQLIDRHRRTAPAAEENRTALRTARVLLEITQIGVADHELLLGGGHYRIIFSHI